MQSLEKKIIYYCRSIPIWAYGPSLKMRQDQIFIYAFNPLFLTPGASTPFFVSIGLGLWLYEGKITLMDILG
jgi:hypothetical protein